jgi:hypothetical protein
MAGFKDSPRSGSDQRVGPAFEVPVVDVVKGGRFLIVAERRP